MIDTLDKDEIARLTGYKRKAEQYRFLIDCGIPVKVNAAGDLLVHRRVAESWLGVDYRSSRTKQRREPRLA